jgi:hypothetical protein
VHYTAVMIDFSAFTLLTNLSGFLRIAAWVLLVIGFDWLGRHTGIIDAQHVIPAWFMVIMLLGPFLLVHAPGAWLRYRDRHLTDWAHALLRRTGFDSRMERFASLPWKALDRVSPKAANLLRGQRHPRSLGKPDH